MYPRAFDRLALTALAVVCLWAGLRGWLADHPEHDPWAPLTLDQRDGWATDGKLADLRSEPAACAGFLARSGIAARSLPATGEGACRRTDRQNLVAPAALDVALSPAGAQATCAVDAALAWWLEHGVQASAQRHFGQRVARIEQLGTYNCRRIGGGDSGTWSEHATGNAIDVAGFVLADGTRIRVLADWSGEGPKAAFLHEVRDAACAPFATVLSPDYNTAHADHLHLDQARRGLARTACR